jgi:hypothetical protein
VCAERSSYPLLRVPTKYAGVQFWVKAIQEWNQFTHIWNCCGHKFQIAVLIQDIKHGHPSPQQLINLTIAMISSRKHHLTTN